MRPNAIRRVMKTPIDHVWLSPGSDPVALQSSSLTDFRAIEVRVCHRVDCDITTFQYDNNGDLSREKHIVGLDLSGRALRSGDDGCGSRASSLTHAGAHQGAGTINACVETCGTLADLPSSR